MKSIIIVKLFLWLYVVALVVFDNPVYIKYMHALNVAMLLVYLLQKIVTGNHKIYFGYMPVLFACFAFYAISSIVWTQDPVSTLAQSKTILLVLINIILIQNIIKDTAAIEIIFHAVVFAIFVNLLISFNVFSIGWEVEEGWRFQGTTVKSNVLANICVFGLVSSLVFFSKPDYRYKAYGFFGLVSCLYVVLLTASKKGLIACLLILLGYFIFRRGAFKPAVSFTLFALFGGTLFVMLDGQSVLMSNSALDLEYLMSKLTNRFELFLAGVSEGGVDQSTEVRFDLARNGLLLWQDYPFFGVGLGGFASLYGTYAHNNYVDLLANLGLIGFILYYLIYVKLILKSLANKNKSPMATLFTLYILIMLLSELAVVTYLNKTLIIFIMVASIAVLQSTKQVPKKSNMHD